MMMSITTRWNYVSSFKPIFWNEMTDINSTIVEWQMGGRWQIGGCSKFGLKEQFRIQKVKFDL